MNYLGIIYSGRRYGKWTSYFYDNDIISDTQKGLSRDILLVKTLAFCSSFNLKLTIQKFDYLLSPTFTNIFAVYVFIKQSLK